MGGKMSRDKGKVWEREVAAAFRVLFGDGVKRGWQAREGHDAPDVDGTPFWLEAKHHVLVNIMGAVRQGLEDRKKAKDERWVVAITKSNRAVPLATMPWTEFMQLIREWVDAKADFSAVTAKLKAVKPNRGDLEKELAEEKQKVVKLVVYSEQVEHQLAAAREEAAKYAENWGENQDRIALLKETDGALGAAEMHAAEALMGRRIAHAIRTGYSVDGPPGDEKAVHPPVQPVPEPAGATDV